MPPCNNPTAWNRLVVGTKYEVYPRAQNGDNLILTGWFVARRPVQVAGHDDWDAEGIESYKAEFREDAPHQPGAARDPNGEYSDVWLKFGPQIVGQRFCEVDELANGMGNMHIAPQAAPQAAAVGAEDEEMNGGRRRKRAKKTRKHKRRGRKTKRSSK